MTTSVRRPRSPVWKAIISLSLVAGIALRVWVYRSALAVPDSDEGVVGLMARHVLDGEVTTFFWGQGFGGSQEALLTAPIFALAGSGWLTLRLVPIVHSGLAAIVVFGGSGGGRSASRPRPSPAAGCGSFRRSSSTSSPTSRASTGAASSTPRCSCCSSFGSWSGRHAGEPRSTGWSSGSRCGRARNSCRSSSRRPPGRLATAGDPAESPARRGGRGRGRGSGDRLEPPERLELARLSDREHDVLPAPASHLRLTAAPDASRSPDTVHAGAVALGCARPPRSGGPRRALRLRRLADAAAARVAPLRRRRLLSRSSTRSRRRRSSARSRDTSSS